MDVGRPRLLPRWVCYIHGLESRHTKETQLQASVGLRGLRRADFRHVAWICCRLFRPCRNRLPLRLLAEPQVGGQPEPRLQDQQGDPRTLIVDVEPSGRAGPGYRKCCLSRGWSDQIQASVTDTGGVPPSTNCTTRVVHGPYCPLSSVTQDNSHIVLYRGENNSSESEEHPCLLDMPKAFSEHHPG